MLCAKVEISSYKKDAIDSVEWRCDLLINDHSDFVKLVKLSAAVVVAFYLLLFVRIFVHLIIPLLSSGIL